MDSDKAVALGGESVTPISADASKSPGGSFLSTVSVEGTAFDTNGEVEFLRLLQIGHPSGNISLLQADRPSEQSKAD